MITDTVNIERFIKEYSDQVRFSRSSFKICLYQNYLRGPVKMQPPPRQVSSIDSDSVDVGWVCLTRAPGDSNTLDSRTTG